MNTPSIISSLVLGLALEGCTTTVAPQMVTAPQIQGTTAPPQPPLNVTPVASPWVAPLGQGMAPPPAQPPQPTVNVTQNQKQDVTINVTKP